MPNLRNLRVSPKRTFDALIDLITTMIPPDGQHQLRELRVYHTFESEALALVRPPIPPLRTIPTLLAALLSYSDTLHVIKIVLHTIHLSGNNNHVPFLSIADLATLSAFTNVKGLIVGLTRGFHLHERRQRGRSDQRDAEAATALLDRKHTPTTVRLRTASRGRRTRCPRCDRSSSSVGTVPASRGSSCTSTSLRDR